MSVGSKHRPGLWLAVVAMIVTSVPISAATPRRPAPRPPAPSAAEPAQEGLSAFRSDEELRAFIRTRAERTRSQPMPPPAPPPPAMAAPSQDAQAAAPSTGAYARGEVESVVVSGSANRGRDDGITNNQTQGVDEGDIVKLRGDLLVILRRGRLFTVSIAGGAMRPVSQLDVTPPGATASGSDWYDEMLIAGDRVIVIGYSYNHGGTDIYRFRIDRSGKLAYEDAYQLRSADYYSERNYATRLIGQQLILYTPLPLQWTNDPLEALPGLRRWRQGDEQTGYRRIASSREIYIPAQLREDEDSEVDTLHTVTTCNLASAVMDCSATGVLGSEARTFYVSQSAVYLWTETGLSEPEDVKRGEPVASAFLFRMPLNRTRPSAMGTRGMPIDQFSFREDSDGVVNVLVQSQGGGDAMWRSEFSQGSLALLRVPVRSMGNGSREAPWTWYRPLPGLTGSYSMHDRYVGGYLLYGASTSDGAQRTAGEGNLIVVPVRGGPITRLSIASGVDRLEALGGDALAVGSTDEDVILNSIELSPNARPRVGDRFVRRGAAESEDRSHGFFYRPDDDSADGANGILGLPISKQGNPRFSSLFSQSAAMLFLRRDARALSGLGELEASQEGIEDDHCIASCVDWYGNARPIFVGGRVFALLGYEIVEGQVRGRRIREIGRVSFSPGGIDR